jgi:membrane dipeptidase
MGEKQDRGYRAFEYLRAPDDYPDFKLAKEIGRVPEDLVPLSDAEEKRVAALMDREPVVSIHEHTAVFPEDPKEIFEYARQGRQVTGYAGLARSGIDVVFENFMDGTALITSKAGWKWDDIVLDIGMRFSDIDHQELVYVARTMAEVLDAKPTGRIAFVAALEAATAIENEVDRVDVLYGLGIRCMGITYSEANALGSGLKERTDGGLSDLGRAVVERMNRLGMTIDVAHCGDQTSLDTIKASRKPIFITHAGARALWSTPRMKPDAVIRACAERGGAIGIEAAPHTTLTEKHRSHSVESVMEHVAYCIELVGVDHVALGPDTLFGDHVALHHAFAAQLATGRINEGVTFSEVPYVRGMENPGEAMRNGIRWLVKHGYSDDDVRKVGGANALRVLKETWAR